MYMSFLISPVADFRLVPGAEFLHYDDRNNSTVEDIQPQSEILPRFPSPPTLDHLTPAKRQERQEQDMNNTRNTDDYEDCQHILQDSRSHHQQEEAGPYRVRRGSCSPDKYFHALKSFFPQTRAGSHTKEQDSQLPEAVKTYSSDGTSSESEKDGIADHGTRKRKQRSPSQSCLHEATKYVSDRPVPHIDNHAGKRPDSKTQHTDTGKHTKVEHQKQANLDTNGDARLSAAFKTAFATLPQLKICSTDPSPMEMPELSSVTSLQAYLTHGVSILSQMQQDASILVQARLQQLETVDFIQRNWADAMQRWEAKELQV